MEAEQLLLEKNRLTEEFDDINTSVSKLLTAMGNASEIKSVADKCLKTTKNEFSKQVEAFTIYENSTLSLHESVKALMAECEQLNEELKAKESASENMKQKIEEAEKTIAAIENELQQCIKLRQRRKYDSDGVLENSETLREKLKKKNEILQLLSGMQIFEFEDKYEGVLTGRYNQRMKCFECPKQQDPKLSTTNLLWDNIQEFYSQGGMAEWSKALRLGRSLLRELLQVSLHPMDGNQKAEGPGMNEKLLEQYTKLMLFADNLKEMIELAKCVVQSSKKHRKNPHMLPSLTDDEIFKLSKSLKQLSSIMKADCTKNSVDKAHRMFAELSEQNLNYLKQVSIKAIVKMESYFEDRLPLIKNAKPKFDVVLSDYNIENCRYNALKLKFEQASESGKLVKKEIKIKAEQRLNQAREAYHKELHNCYRILNNFSDYENEVMQALRMLIQYRLEFHENALKIFKQ
ncbi:hypothetical protein T4A_3691 [Trichinella pseudospiralis]|uniref:BAR domain-containing protein n=1 Tax=Trichinella pseudospiralis TaxID=6337 RepID=A0A0V1F0U5_TRIPS|nr:hypothetical protein T4A_3691 [Trichinella pseudospiralis]